jgi:predicted nucleotidyltransferase
MRKKKTHPSPKEYRVEYKINGAQNSSMQYYNVFHSSEALDFLAHTYRRGHIHGGELKVIAVEEYNRFSNRWLNRTAKAAEHAEAPEVSVSDTGIVFLKPSQ